MPALQVLRPVIRGGACGRRPARHRRHGQVNVDVASGSAALRPLYRGDAGSVRPNCHRRGPDRHQRLARIRVPGECRRKPDRQSRSPSNLRLTGNGKRQHPGHALCIRHHRRAARKGGSARPDNSPAPRLRKGGDARFPHCAILLRDGGRFGQARQDPDRKPAALPPAGHTGAPLQHWSCCQPTR